MDNNSNGGPFGSPISNNSVLSASGSILDSDKIQKIVNNYQKIKNQNAILKKALVQEQQKTNDLEKTNKEKEQRLTTALQEHDVLDFNNQRLTKRITLMQEHMNEKKEGSSSSSGQWFGGKNAKQLEMQRKEDEIQILKNELQEKIDDNEGLHSVNIEKENAYKTMEADYKQSILKQQLEIQEKQDKIQSLLNEQKESEKKLHDQTKGLRDAISLLEVNFKQIYISTKQRDQSFSQLSQLIQSGLNSNLPSISLDYPLENITPSNERFSFEDVLSSIENSGNQQQQVVIDSSTIKSITDRNTWTPSIREVINSVQSFLSYHLEQISSLISSHRLAMSKLVETNNRELLELNCKIDDITLAKEELEFRVNGLTEQLLKKELEISESTQNIITINETISKLQSTNSQLDTQLITNKEECTALKKQLDTQVKQLKSEFELEMKQIKDQNQGLLKHQKGLLNSKLDEKDLIISNLEKKLSNIKIINSNSSSNDLLDLDLSCNNTSNNSNNNNNNTNNNSSSLVDLSFLENNGQITTTSPVKVTNNNNNSNSLINLDDDNIIIDQQPQQPEEKEAPKFVSDRFKLSVLDETGDESDSLNFSITDKERENEMKIYYENKITQLLNKISNIDAKALRYYDQYQQLLKKGGASQTELDAVTAELKNCKADNKNTKDELEVTRVNYDQQMRYLTEQFISLNENVSSLDSQLIKIKQYKVSCGKCKHWNQLEFVFSTNNQGLYCSKGHPILTIQP